MAAVRLKLFTPEDVTGFAALVDAAPVVLGELYFDVDGAGVDGLETDGDEYNREGVGEGDELRDVDGEEYGPARADKVNANNARRMRVFMDQWCSYSSTSNWPRVAVT